MDSSLDKRGKTYLYGAYQCFVLDHFVPGWKMNFLKEKKNMDEVIGNFLKLSREQKTSIAKRLKTKYAYNELYSKHDAIIKKKRSR